MNPFQIDPKTILGEAEKLAVEVLGGETQLFKRRIGEAALFESEASLLKGELSIGRY